MPEQSQNCSKKWEWYQALMTRAEALLRLVDQAGPGCLHMSLSLNIVRGLLQGQQPSHQECRRLKSAGVHLLVQGGWQEAGKAGEQGGPTWRAAGRRGHRLRCREVHLVAAGRSAADPPQRAWLLTALGQLPRRRAAPPAAGSAARPHRSPRGEARLDPPRQCSRAAQRGRYCQS